jgi:hypothetical protein
VSTRPGQFHAGVAIVLDLLLDLPALSDLLGASGVGC